MKKLLYIDNDAEPSAKNDLIYVVDALQDAGLEAVSADDFQIITRFNNMDRQEAFKLIYSGEYCICTFSSYCQSFAGNSRNQILRFLETGGRSNVRNIIYYDCSGNLPGTLNWALFDKENALYVLQAIETNYILSQQKGEIIRLRIDLTQDDRTIFRFEPVNVVDLLNS